MDALSHFAVSFFLLMTITQMNNQRLPTKTSQLQTFSSTQQEQYLSLKIFVCSLFGILSDVIDKPLFGVRLWFHSLVVLSILWFICYQVIVFLLKNLKPWIFIIAIASLFHLVLDFGSALPILYPLTNEAYWLEFELEVEQRSIPTVHSFKLLIRSMPIADIHRYNISDAATVEGLVMFLIIIILVFLDTITSRLPKTL